MLTLETHKPYSITIVGAGAAGYFAAAAIRRNCPHISVNIVHDPVVPHIGVGETLGWNSKYVIKTLLGLEESVWMPKADSSYKLAIKHNGFTDVPGDHLHTMFWWNPAAYVIQSSIADVYKFGDQVKFWNTDLTKYSLWDIWLHLYKRGLRKIEDYQGDLAELYWYSKYNTMPWDKDGIAAHADRASTHSYNINSDKFKDVVHELVGAPNGVNIIPIKVKRVNISNGRIDSLLLDNDQTIKSDLYIDCTGFKRLLVSQLPGFVWEPANEYFNNTAIVGRYNRPEEKYYPDNTVNFYAMKYGWLFSIPFNGRNGEGYQFNRDIFGNEDEIIADYEQMFPEKSGSLVKKITWNPGYYNKAFSENCIAIGISQGIVDAFDANNMSSSITFMLKMIRHMQDDVNAEFAWRDEYNTTVHSMTDDIKFRIQYCFGLATKNDSVYWNEMKEGAKKYDLLNKVKSEIFNNDRRFVQLKNNLFYGQGPITSQSLYYRINFPIPTLPISEKFEQVAVNFFKFFNEHNKINAQHSEPAADFYHKFYNK
jgi:tryptophan halogenase